MQIIGVDAAVLGVEEIDEGKSFYRDFGLTEVETGASGASFATRDGSRIDLRSATDPGLPAAVSGGSTIREIVWAVKDDAELERIAAELTRDRPVMRDADGTVRSIDDDGYALAFRVTRRGPFTPGEARLNIFGRPSVRPVNTRFDFDAPITPATIGHIVLFTPDVGHAMRFYVDRLGFRVSDAFRDGAGVFLRAQGSTDHHTLFLIRQPQGKRGLHHISFHVTDMNEVILGGKRLTQRGWKTKVGPGRHVIGSNAFWYFESPCGGAMELACDMDHADDDWEMREWDYKPENVASWSMTFNPPVTSDTRIASARALVQRAAWAMAANRSCASAARAGRPPTRRPPGARR